MLPILTLILIYLIVFNIRILDSGKKKPKKTPPKLHLNAGFLSMLPTLKITAAQRFYFHLTHDLYEANDIRYQYILAKDMFRVRLNL